MTTRGAPIGSDQMCVWDAFGEYKCGFKTAAPAAPAAPRPAVTEGYAAARKQQPQHAAPEPYSRAFGFAPVEKYTDGGCASCAR